MDIAAQHGWKAIPTGIAHGTVTVVLPSRVIEVTTLRHDVATDGRRAMVAFTDDFRADAARRDFTMNALYMDGAGTIYDWFDGKKDVETRTVRFIGDAPTRIAEDGLRMLRYFRFFARFGGGAVEASALEAIAAQKSMLTNLSGERIATEMRKLLAAENPVVALQLMDECGLAPYLAQTEWRLAPLQHLLQYERQYRRVELPWIRLLAMLVPAQRVGAAGWIGERWKLSRAERDALLYLAQPMAAVTAAQVKEWLRHADRALVEARVMLAAVDGDLAEELGGLLALTRDWPIPIFPLVAHDLLQHGFQEGKALGDMLRALETVWVVSGYIATKATLLAGLGHKAGGAEGKK